MTEKHFFPTTGQQGRELKKEIEKAINQEDAILRVFNPKAKLLTPWEIHDKLKKYPITSIRRAMTVLTNRGLLKKTAIKKPGPYGKGSYCWGLNITKSE